MSAVIDKPNEVASEVLDRAEITGSTVLVQYSKTEAALVELRAQYAGVQFDLTTTAGDKAARAGRLALKNLRTGLEAKRKEFKAPALEFGAKIDAEAKRITAEIVALETPIDAQIVADEKRRADEKAERDRLEAIRVSGIRARIDMMRGCVAKAQGLPSTRIANGIAAVEAIPVEPAAWEEFAEEAATAKAETLAAMRSMFNATKAREDEAERVEAQRIENERVAAEQKAAADKLAAEQAEFARQRAEFEAQQAEAAHQAAAKVEAEKQTAAKAELAAAKASDEGAELSPAAQVINEAEGAERFASAHKGVAAAFSEPALGIVQQIPASTLQTPAANSGSVEQSTIKLGDINASLKPYIETNQAGLQAMGFEPVGRDRAAVLYRRSDLPLIYEAIGRHIESLRLKLAA